MSLEEMIKKQQYKTGGLEAMVGGSTGGLESMVAKTQPIAQTTAQPDWAKPGPRVAKLNPLTPGYQEITRHQEAIKPYSVQYQKPGDTFTDIRERMRAKTTDPKNSSFMQGNIYQKPLEEMPGFSGFYSAYTMDIPTRFDPETFAKAKEANPLAYNIGRGAGHITKYASGYGALGPVIEGIPALQAIGNPFLRTMATEGAKDLVIGGSIGGLEGLIQGKGPAEIAKDMPKQLAYDALANLVFYGAGKAIKGLKGSSPRWAKPVQEAAEETPWAKSINMPDGRRIGDTMSEPQKVFYRGTIDGETKRIKEPFEAARGKTFAARSKRSASMYGQQIEEIVAKPEAKILYEESKEFGLITGRKRYNTELPLLNQLRKNETIVDAVNDAVRKAEKAGYDAISFSRDSDIGTIILNENAFIRNANISPIKEIAVPTGKSGNAIIDSARDISSREIFTNDVYRNFEKVFGQNFPEVKKMILDPFDASKAQKVKFEQNWLNSLKSEVVDQLGISKGSKLSALVQQFGEKRISLDELKQTVPNDWQKVVEADKWFRKAYDELLDNVNAVRAQIYPNNPEKIIPKRQDYYRHFRELSETIEGLKNIFETPAKIDPKLVGISEFTKPKSKWQSFAQRRTGYGAFKDDAVGGFLEYLPAASWGIHIDPHTNSFRKLATELAEKTGETKHLNNFITFLNRFANDLAGKTNPIDRTAQEFIGRKAFRMLDWLNRRTKMNVILGNVGSAFAQLGNVPNGIAYAKQYSIPGIKRTIRSIFDPDPAIKQSGFILERFADRMYKQFDTKLIDQPIKFATWMMEQSDKIGTEFIWNSVYEKALAEGIQDAVKYADDITRKMVAGRGIGEVPLAQKSRLVQMFIPFTLEVGNMWKVQKEFLQAKDIAALVTLYLSTFAFNEVMERTRGTRVLFDPIDAVRDAFTEEDLTLVERGGRIAGEVISNIPTGTYLAQMYPEYGKEFMGVQLPTRRQLFGRNDPTRYGSGIMVMKGIQDPLYKVLPPFGGLQLQKTVKGAQAIQKEGVYTQNKLMYPVDTDTANKAKGLLFGPGAFRESKDYYEQNRRPLSEAQTGAVTATGQPKAAYDYIIRQREAENKEAKFKAELEQMLISGDKTQYAKIRDKYGVPDAVMNEYLNRLINNTNVIRRVLQARITKTKDPAEKQRLMNELNKINMQELNKLVGQ